jgi:hypothetical protein
MNNLAQELSDAQLDAISGGCYYRPEPPKCDPDPCYKPCETKHDDYDCYKPKKKHCESPWERWYDRAHDYFENKY